MILKATFDKPGRNIGNREKGNLGFEGKLTLSIE
jgi:hypothetical protein